MLRENRYRWEGMGGEANRGGAIPFRACAGIGYGLAGSEIFCLQSAACHIAYSRFTTLAASSGASRVGASIQRYVVAKVMCRLAYLRG
ncbi:MAG: hypothetical protein K2P74_07015 [Nitrosomonas sp.]|nr:hypothetical protein [Nitrosomonas sp.]